MKYSLVGVKGAYASQSETVIPIPRLGSHIFTAHAVSSPKSRPVPGTPKWEFNPQASGRLTTRPTIAPVRTGCTRNVTVAARIPTAKRLQKACNNIVLETLGMLAGDRHQYVNHTKTTP